MGIRRKPDYTVGISSRGCMKLPFQPWLMVGARYDTMDPGQWKKQNKLVQGGDTCIAPNGSSPGHVGWPEGIYGRRDQIYLKMWMKENVIY